MKKPLKKRIEDKFKNAFLKNRPRVTYFSDGLGVKNKNLGFMNGSDFKKAWDFSVKGNLEGWDGNVPDLRWRVHICIWAAQNCMKIEGDFVEFGVHTGILSMAVCHYLNFGNSSKKMYLYDTYEGIPTRKLKGEDEEFAKNYNDVLYFDVYNIAKKNFLDYPNVLLVKGELPGSLDQNSPDKISYVSIDLNNADYEIETITAIWERISKGGHIVLDDYAFPGHEKQYDQWNKFAQSKGTSILTVPTGQGLIIKA